MVIFATLRVSRCAFCAGVLHSWVEGDDPMPDHRHWFPFCPFVLGQNVGNIPLGERTEQHYIPEKGEQTQEEDRETVTNTEVDSDDIINKIPWAGEAGDIQEERPVF